MLIIEYSNSATEQLNEILSNTNIYDIYGHFTQMYINWNSEFYRYINENIISKQNLSNQGIYPIGKIGTLEYKHFALNDVEVFEIIEFRFSKLPYKTQNSKIKIVGDGGYGYKITQSLFNNKCAILSPQNKRLCKYVFDDIIGFHNHFGYNENPTAIGFIGDRVYKIEMDGNISLIWNMSKSDFLNMKQQIDDAKKRLKCLIRESVKSVINNIKINVLQNRLITN